jgi:hypothetical protein
MTAKSFRFIAVALVVVLLGWLLPRAITERGGARPVEPTARPIIAMPPDSLIRGRIEAEHHIGDYLIRVYADTIEDLKVVEIQHAGRRVWSASASGMTLREIGRDLTGDGVPDLVVEEFSGGAHCCTVDVVLGLGESLEAHGTIDAEDGDVAFEDVDHDSIPEVRYPDFRLRYWRDYAFAETTAPDVILRFRDGAYRPACDLMRTPAPDAATLAKQARDLRGDWDSGDPPADLLGYVVELVYHGHADLAWQFLDTAWPAPIAGRTEFLRDLRAQLSHSPCWSEPPAPRPTT